MKPGRIQLQVEQVDALLDDLCRDYGFCLPPGARTRFRNSPPTAVERFADVVFECEGLDPRSAQHSKLHAEVTRRVAEHFDMARQP